MRFPPRMTTSSCPPECLSRSSQYPGFAGRNLEDARRCPGFVSYGSINVKSGKLVLEEGAELALGAVRKGAEVLSEYGNEIFMGPPRKGDEIIDVALTVTGPLSPDVLSGTFPAVSNPTPVRLRHDHHQPPCVRSTRRRRAGRHCLVRRYPGRDLHDHGAVVRGSDDQLRTTTASCGHAMPAVRVEFHYAEPQVDRVDPLGGCRGAWAILAHDGESDVAGSSAWI